MKTLQPQERETMKEVAKDFKRVNKKSKQYRDSIQ
jgi:hypothetical protein